MKLTKKIRRGAVSLAAALYTAYLTALTVFADNETATNSKNLNAAQSAVKGSFTKVIHFVQPIAYGLVGLVIVVMGIILIWGGDKAKEKVKSHAALIIIGCILVAAGATIARVLTDTLSAASSGS